MEAIEAVEAIPIEAPIKIKKPRSEKQIEAFAKAIAKKKELTEINKQFNESKKIQKDEQVELKKRFIKSVKEPEPEEEEKFKKKPKKKLIPPPPIESESEEEEEEVIVQRKSKPKKKKPVKKIVYEDTSSEDSEEESQQIVNYAKLIKKSAREKLKDELQEQKLRSAMSSLGYI
jgi:hypothetical protein